MPLALLSKWWHIDLIVLDPDSRDYNPEMLQDYRSLVKLV